MSDPITLNRWLDRSPITRLSRATEYILLPAIPATSFDLLLYPSMVVMFRFNDTSLADGTTIPHNLSLDLDSIATLFGNDSLAWHVAYDTNEFIDAVYPAGDPFEGEQVRQDRAVRYRLNNAVVPYVAGRTFPTDEGFPLYEGQVLPGHALRIEGWTPKSAAPYSLSYSFAGGQLKTSTLSDVDIRQGASFELGKPVATETYFAAYNAAAAGSFTLPLRFVGGQILPGTTPQYAGVPNSNFNP